MAVIIAGGEITDYQKIKTLISAQDYIICADGGTRHARALGLIPQLIIGDMDSVLPEELQYYQQRGATVYRYPREKDEVDTELALREALNSGQRHILLVGVTGGRLDHTLANIHLLVIAANAGVKAVMVDERQRITLITPNIPAKLTGWPGKLLSLLPLTTEVTGVKSRGLKWELNGRTFTVGKPFGISNQFTGSIAEISVKEGFLLCISEE